MCLYITSKKVQVAQEDIICYKVFVKQGEDLTSPYQHMHYEYGAMYVSETPIIVKHGFTMRACVKEGFHSISNEQEAELLKSDLQMWTSKKATDKYVVVLKCLIPAGTRYVVGYFSDFKKSFDSFCSERIKVLEEV